MKVATIDNPVSSKWLRRLGKRLDASTFLSGAVEARMILDDLPVDKEPLSSLATGHNGGIYNGPQFKRNYVSSPEHGVPFLTASSMLLADLSTVSLLSKKDAYSKKLRYLKIVEDATLISCSGTIGRMVYARPEMEGMWTSQDVLKVVPDHSKIPPGYLFAYLSSKYGVSLVTAGTYGAIIQHLEPEHIENLPVPRLGGHVEKRAHALVSDAARLRTEASDQRNAAKHIVEDVLSWTPSQHKDLWSLASSTGLGRRADAFHHSDIVASARRNLSNQPDTVRLGSVVQSVFEPNRGSRYKVDDPEYGVPFLSSSEVFRIRPEGSYLISKTLTPNFESFLITEKDLFLPRSGQLGGIIGRAVLPLSTNYGHAASEHLVRVRCKTVEDAHYLWAIFASKPGYYATIGTAYGTSIPSLDTELIANLEVPWDLGEIRKNIVRLVGSFISKLALAIDKESEAIALVEDHISSHSP